MNQEIEVVLMEKDDVDCLVFKFESESMEVNLNDVSGQQDMKKVFSEILRMLCDNDIQLSLEVVEGYNRNLYKEVCSEYINDLNVEIKKVREEIEKL